MLCYSVNLIVIGHCLILRGNIYDQRRADNDDTKPRRLLRLRSKRI